MGVFHFYGKNQISVVECFKLNMLFWQVIREVQGGIRYFDHYVPEVIYLLCLTTLNNSGFNKQIILKLNNEYNRGC